MKYRIAAATAALTLMTAWTASAIVVTTGTDPAATVYGGVRYRDFGGNPNEWDIGLMDNRVSTTSPRASTTFYNSGGNWAAVNTILFQYIPLAGGNDKIYTKVINSRGTAQPYELDWTLPDPALTLNYLKVSVRDINVANQMSDYVQFVLTDLNGNPLSGSQYTFTADNAYLSWYLTDPTAFANGFILNGTINLTGDLTPNINEKNELVDLYFGNSPNVAVPEPSTIIAGALLLLPFGLSTVRMLRKSRKA